MLFQISTNIFRMALLHGWKHSKDPVEVSPEMYVFPRQTPEWTERVRLNLGTDVSRVEHWRFWHWANKCKTLRTHFVILWAAFWYPMIFWKFEMHFWTNLKSRRDCFCRHLYRRGGMPCRDISKATPLHQLSQKTKTRAASEHGSAVLSLCLFVRIWNFSKNLIL